eukprot:760311-Hanusia_phi.AAC.1
MRGGVSSSWVISVPVATGLRISRGGVVGHTGGRNPGGRVALEGGFIQRILRGTSLDGGGVVWVFKDQQGVGCFKRGDGDDFITEARARNSWGPNGWGGV